MNQIARFNAFATQIALRTATNPFASRVLMLALPVTFALAAVILRRPPCGGSAGSGGTC